MGTEHTSHHRLTALSSLLFLVHPHHLPVPSVALGFLILSQQDTEDSCGLVKLLTWLSQTPSALLPPITVFRPSYRWGLWLSTSPWVLPIFHILLVLSQAFHLCILGRTLVVFLLK